MTIPPILLDPHTRMIGIANPREVVAAGPRYPDGGTHKLTLSTRTIAEAMPDFGGYNREAPIKIVSWRKDE